MHHQNNLDILGTTKTWSKECTCTCSSGNKDTNRIFGHSGRSSALLDELSREAPKEEGKAALKGAILEKAGSVSDGSDGATVNQRGECPQAPAMGGCVYTDLP